mgnify:CR=1 FL=1
MKKAIRVVKRKEVIMIETIYEKKQTEEKKVKNFRLPNNRRQIGQPYLAELEVFIEDYAFSFAKGLAERDYTGCVVGVLVGEYFGTGEKILIRGVLEARDVLVHDVVCFTEENWAGIYRDIREYFPSQQIVGWFLGGPGFLLEDEERQKKILMDNFGGGDKVLFKVDSIEKEQHLLHYKEGRLKELQGYYIYYEKNTEMQNYMVGTKQIVLEEEEVKIVPKEEKQESILPKKRQDVNITSFYRLFYATGGILTCLAILVIVGLAMQIKERDELKALLEEQVRQTTSLQQVYIVQEGETVASICLKFYETIEIEPEIRLLNGLLDGEEPIPGQKLYLP